MQFTALEDFWSDELQSQYCKGLSYRVRPGDDRLAGLVPKWIAEGKIAEGVVVTALGGSVEGTGKVVSRDEDERAVDLGGSKRR